MSNDTEQYQYIIDQLLPILRAPDFDELFKGITGELTRPQQFQIKCELNRLRKPCLRHIDLRGHVDGDVRPYEYGKKNHYLDSTAIKVFEQQLQYYGEYTTGVYEQVTTTENNYRVLHQKEKEQLLKAKDLAVKNKKSATPIVLTDVEDETGPPLHGAEKVQFQSYAIRSEERMNYSIAIDVQFGLAKKIRAATSDLSVSGCKLKINKDILVEPGQYAKLRFKGLEEEFALGLPNGIEYQVVAVELLDNFQYVRMKRSYREDIQSFDGFLTNFINGNKRRYKVNMDNTEDAVIIKGYEQYYIPRIASLPLFFNSIGVTKDTTDTIADTATRYRLSAVLTTENNKKTLRYWFNHKQEIVLDKVFSPKRIQHLLATDQDSLMFSFTHTHNGQIYHYVALSHELLNDEHIRHLFLGFGGKKPNWRVHKVQLSLASYDKAHIPLSLPDSAGEEVKQLNRPPSARVAGVLQNTAFIIALTDITEYKKAKQYQSYEFNIKDANQLRPFGITPNKEPQAKVEVVAVDYVNLRRETRFLYKTDVVINQPPEQPVMGFTRDFSTKGIQVEVEEASEIQKGDTVLIGLPLLQKISRKFKLQHLPYEAVMISKNKRIINLRIIESKEPHAGKAFFQQLIQNNRDKLTAAEEAQTVPGLPLAMRNMYVSVCPNMPFYIHRKGVRYFLDVIGRGGHDTSLHLLMDHFSQKESYYNTYPLTKDATVTNLFANVLKNMRRQDPPHVLELLVSVKRGQQQAENAITVELAQDLSTDHSHEKFIKEALENDLLFCYRLFISRTGRPDINYIAKELKYVGNYAIHRAKSLEEKLWSVIGVADAIDISEEMMFRYGYSRTDIEIQKQAKAFYFNQSTNINL